MNKLFSDLRESLKPQRTEIKKYKVGNNSVSLIHKGESYEVEVDNVTIGEQFDDIIFAFNLLLFFKSLEVISPFGKRSSFKASLHTLEIYFFDNLT